MARIRNIKPGIMTNEDLCELGPYAYILFTGLWMLADREGRLEYRPRRIKAEAMPLWDDVSAKAVENLLEKLCEAGFLHRYDIGGKPYLQIVTWQLHQNPDPRERASKIPPPPSANGSESTTSDSTVELPCEDNVIPMSCRVGYGRLEVGNGNKDVEARERTSADVEKPTPTIEKPTQAEKENKPERKPPERAYRSATSMHSAGDVLRSSSVAGVVYKPEDVALVRNSLSQLAIAQRMAPPDDALVHRVIDAAHGAGGSDICEALVELWKRNKFRAMYSWGFVPLVISQVFKAA
jgi:hypothetical protein